MVSILCPTRDRAKILQRMIDSAYATCKGEIEILLYFDDDDETRHRNFSPAIKMIGKSEGVGKAWNIMAEKCKGDFLMMGNDDIIFRTLGWDGILKEQTKQFKDNIFVAWFDDGKRRRTNKCTFPIISRTWYECVGRFVPECFNFLFHDTWLYDVGRLLDRECYIPEVLVEHMHFAFKKSKKDATYERHIRGTHKFFARFPEGDRAIFNNTQGKRKEEVEKLKAFIKAKSE